MQALRLKKVLTAFLGFLALSSAALTSAQTPTLPTTLDPPPPFGLGDDTTLFVQGTPGDFGVLVWSLQPGPTPLPIVGEIQVGMPFNIVNLGFFPDDGQHEVPINVTCSFVVSSPAFSQILSLGFANGIEVTGKSEQVILTVDGELIGDCNANLIDDDCEIELGGNDCNGNSVPDDCDSFDDCNGNFVPDECELELGDCDGDGVLDVCEPDCDNDTIPDDCEDDCDGNQVPDECEPAPDCNNNSVPDACDILTGTSQDVDGDGVPDECQDCDNDGTPDSLESDCDANGTPDDCEPSLDCNGNSVPDRCDISSGTSTDLDGDMVPDECQDCDNDGTPDSLESDCDANGTPDDCEPGKDCNGNGVPDRCDLLTGKSTDLDGDLIPDECQDCDNDGTPDSLESDCDANGTPDDCEPSLDCNGNSVPDRCDISSGTSTDLDGDMVPDECQDCDSDGTPDSLETDCDANGTPDDCEPSVDCNRNGVPDRCDISSGTSGDLDGNMIPDDCEDCDGDGKPDSLEVDCDGNGTPDDCEPFEDCNGNLVPDRCDITQGTSTDLDGNQIPDECEDCDADGTPDALEADCDGNGTPDDCEPSLDCNGNTVPDRCDILAGTSTDLDGDTIPDECQDCDDDGSPDSLEPDCDGDGLPDDCEPDCNDNDIPDDCEGCGFESRLTWSADGCTTANGNGVFTEFTADPLFCSGNSIMPSTLLQPDSNPGHTCTFDATDGTPGGALAIRVEGGGAFIPSDDDALYFSVMVNAANGSPVKLTDLSFFEQAIDSFVETDSTGTIGTVSNCPPTSYAVRIRRNGNEVFFQEGIPTTSQWSLESFDFGDDPSFTVVNELASFAFEILGYAPVCDGLENIWSLDDVSVGVCCGNSTQAPDCDQDGVPDFCEPDCDLDGTPDDCEPDTDGDGIPDDCDLYSLLWTADTCSPSYFDWSEFVPVEQGDACPGLFVSGSILFSIESHSCTNDAVDDTPGNAFCISDQSEAEFDLGDPDAMTWTVTVNETLGNSASLASLNFFQQAPEQFFSSQQDGTIGSLYENSKPRQYGLRVLRDGVEVFLQTGFQTATTWQYDSIDFGGDPNFDVSNGTATFEFYLLAYDPDGTGDYEVWDLDELSVAFECE